MVTADDKSMYTKIETEHCLEVLRQFLEELQEEGKLPPDFDIEMIVEAAALVMRWNLFECGDCYLKQLAGTAMGTPAAVLWAIIYYYWREKKVLLPRYSHGNKMPLLCRFIDDIFAVVLFGGDDGLTDDEWNKFKEDVDDYGILRWNVEEPSLKVDYLDLTIQLENGRFVTQTYQKPINLYQYLTPNSAHPRWTIRGMITSMLRVYFYQNTHREDYWKIAMQLYKRLKTRG